MNATEMSTEELLMDRLVRAYVKKYKLIELVYGVDSLLNEKELYWKCYGLSSFTRSSTR